MLEVIKFIKQHNEDWRELLSNDPYYINIKEDDNYVLLKYSQIDSDFNEIICRECRGLILSKNEDYKPVRLAFYKFFNFGEPFADRIHWRSCKTRMKIDGSMMSAWYHNGKWHLSTSGAIDAWKTPVNNDNLTFGDVFEKALKNNNLTWDELCGVMCEDYCYTFELVSPETRVVIPYKEADLYLIGIRNMRTLNELNIEDTFFHKACPNIKTPKLYDLSNAKACIQAAEHLGYNEEGYVVVDKYFHRVKIKSPSYVAAHHLALNGAPTEARIFDIVEKGEKNEFLAYFPEYRELFEKIEKKWNDFESQLWYVLDKYKTREEEDYHEKGSINRKQYSEDIMSNEIDRKYAPFIYKLLDSDLISVFIKYQWSKLSREKKLEYLKIKNNNNDDDI